MGYGKRNNSIIQIDNEEIREKLEKINTEVLDAHFGYDGVARKTAGELTREMHKQLILGEQQTATLQQGANVVQSDQASALDVQIPGRTLVSLGNSVLQANKTYIIGDGYGVRFSDGSLFKGPTKFKAPLTERPSILRYATMAGKIKGSTVENPHIIRRGSADHVMTPTESLGIELETADNEKIATRDGVTQYSGGNASTLGNIGQFKMSFSAYEEIERNIGTIKGTTKAEKLANIRPTINGLFLDAYAFGYGPSGNKVTLTRWQLGINAYQAGGSHTASTPSYMRTSGSSTHGSYIDADGFIHFALYAEASDGGATSQVNLDSVVFEVEVSPLADISNPKVPLYELTQAEYDKVFIAWNEAEVKKRYPAVIGAQSIVDPSVTMEGANLFPPFTDSRWKKHPNATIIEPYKIILNRDGSGQYISIDIPIIAGQEYSFNIQGTGSLYPDFRDWQGVKLDNLAFYKWGEWVTFAATNPNAKYIRFALTATEIGEFTFSNPILTIGQPKPFVPRNTDTLKLTTPLRSLSDTKDLLYKDGEKYKVMKRLGVVTLSNDFWYLETGDVPGYKKVAIRNSYSVGTLGMKLEHNTYRIISSKGEVYRNITSGGRLLPEKTIYNGTATFVIGVPNSETGWVDGTAPTDEQIKTYFTNNPFTLIYTLATPIVEEIPFEGVLSIPGTTQVSLSQGGVAPIVDATAKFASSLKSSVQQLQTNQADMQVKDQMILQSIADLYKQMAALGG
ncbi:hypothetical protein [Priestia endophytica]|uniref:Uncharacterized protein n=1 Tax=Priestia endophytica TaxID=135735 RepID=A0AAX1Q6D5_9BACI|nr:hypothetical protein [Priestia endophytica]RAS75256.1 hypothetical protein A3864_16455 [Priestia endophytica]